MDALQQLIRDFLIANPDENYSSIAERGNMPKQTVQKLATTTRRRPPAKDTVARLAAAIRQPLQVVMIAAGYPEEQELDREGRVFAAMYAELDEAGKDEIRRRIEFLMEERRGRRR